MHPIDPKALALRPFSVLDDGWALLVGGVDKPNPMTVSWGGLGTVWNRPVVTVYVRPTRHTYGLLNAHPEFTLNFLPEGRRAALDLCGSLSGRDTDKWSAAKLTRLASEKVQVPRVGEARLAFECRILADFDFDPSRLLDPAVEALYPQRDFHRAYLGEVLAAYSD
ncbi:MAG: flavin reductase family protein [Deltaproteobacteria bacterium]|nr:flavin reductase family protein [Deltaproteobacteria bacterium]